MPTSRTSLMGGSARSNRHASRRAHTPGTIAGACRQVTPRRCRWQRDGGVYLSSALAAERMLGFGLDLAATRRYGRAYFIPTTFLRNQNAPPRVFELPSVWITFLIIRPLPR